MENIKMLLYCCKNKPLLYNPNKYKFDFINQKMDWEYLNGKIVAECDFEVEEIKELGGGEGLLFYTKTLDCLEIVKKACLKTEELADYLYKEYEDSKGYAIYIKNLNIFDKPKELSECMSIKTFENDFVRKTLSPEMVSKAPQNMMKVKMWVDGKEFGMWKNYVLISIRPEWLVKILNGEKTIEVRKKVLKEMVK